MLEISLELSVQNAWTGSQELFPCNNSGQFAFKNYFYISKVAYITKQKYTEVL